MVCGCELRRCLHGIKRILNGHYAPHRRRLMIVGSIDILNVLLVYEHTNADVARIVYMYVAVVRHARTMRALSRSQGSTLYACWFVCTGEDRPVLCTGCSTARAVRKQPLPLFRFRVQTRRLAYDGSSAQCQSQWSRLRTRRRSLRRRRRRMSTSRSARSK